MDDAHRADADDTRRLNRQAAARVRPPAVSPADRDTYARDLARYNAERQAYRAARRQYEADLTRWRGGPD